MISSVLKEYGLKWAINRSLYSMKIKGLKKIPSLEKCFEKEVEVKRVDLFDVSSKELKFFLQNLPNDKKKELIERADLAINGKINGFSSIDLDYGFPMDWQLNPLTGKRTDETQKWYKISDFDQKRGDIKVVWEASRFSHFILFARAYLLTEEYKYVEAFENQLHDWLEKNIYSFGANYKCGQECSLRMVNGLLTYAVLSPYSQNQERLEKDIKELVSCSYRKVLSNFFYAEKCIKNNHTISELMGMIIGAWCSQDLERLSKAYRKLNDVICEQFFEDGGYCQYSFNYQRLALQDIACILSMSKKTGFGLSKEAKDRCMNSSMLLFQCQDSSYDVPNYGSNDGALVFPLTSCSYRDFRPVINTIHALLSNTVLYAHDIHEEELLWWGKQNIDDIPINLIERVSSTYEKAGLFTIRDQRTWAMLIANQYESRPAHMDQLHFDLWMDGINVFCDSGTYSYASKLGKELTRNQFHNTAYISNLTQMNSHGNFMVYDWTIRESYSQDDHSFYGKIISKNEYSHERKVEYFNGTYYIKDQILTNREEPCFIHFYTPCQIHRLIENKFVLIYNGKEICMIEVDGDTEIIQSNQSLYYLKKTKINGLKIKVQKNKVHQTCIKLR